MNKVEETKQMYHAFKNKWRKRAAITIKSQQKFDQDLDDLLQQYATEVSREEKKQHAMDFLDWVIDNADPDPVWSNESNQYYKDWQESDEWKSNKEEQ